MKVYQFATELGLETIALMDKIKEWDLPVKSHMAVLDEDMMGLIKTKLSDTGSATKKKKAKKKATKKKATKKKTSTAKKKTATKKATKKVVKKKAASSSVTKVTKVSSGKTGADPGQEAVATAKGASTEETSAEVTTTKRVIRRKASDVKQAQEAELEKLKEQEEAEAAAVANLEAEASAQASEATLEASTEPAAEAGTEKETAAPAAKAPAVKKARVFGKGIIGKIDLSKVKDPRRTGGNNSTGGARTPGPKSAQRGLRSGFVAPAPSFPVADAANNNRRREYNPAAAATAAAAAKKKAGAAGNKEQPPAAFKATDFRKREMVFQPKKKKVSFLPGKKTEITTAAAHKRIVKVNGTMTLSELAQTMGLKVPQLLKVCMGQGLTVNMNSDLDFDTISLLVPEFDWEAKNVEQTSEDLVESVAFGDLDAEPVGRAPVVTVMGHVDHGKTTLLDSIRKANVARGEAGGITQHIGAYRVFVEKEKPITFIDTPGHAAFTAMRERGAQVTDIVILVVAADDGMMPQTEEAISHAKAAGVPIIVAVNKIDKEGANPDKIKQQLSEKELVPEEWGGDTVFLEVSALKNLGIKELLENIWLHSEILELKANPKQSGRGIVVESKVEKGKGIVATLLVQEGTVKAGQSICAGLVSGKVRRLMDDQGKQVKEAGPSVPVEVMGLSATPNAGDRFDICESDQKAVALAEQRKEEKAQIEIAESNKKVSLEDLLSRVKNDGAVDLPVILKTDVAGSAEAVKGMINKIESDEVNVKFIHSQVGAVSESDVLLASTSGGMIIGFNVRPDSQASKLAKEKGVEIKCYRIIYELVDDVKKAMSGLLTPDIIEKENGKAEVREIFSVPKIGTIGGSIVLEGKINRNDMVRLVREGRVVYEGKITSLKRFKDDAKEVAAGFECGIGIENYNDLKTGDVIEAYVKEEVARELA
ncbi:MAG: translation initiation factor IF-2 [Bdellovibrionales bacterium]